MLFEITTATTALEEATNIFNTLTEEAKPKAIQQFVKTVLQDETSYPSKKADKDEGYVLFKSSDLEIEAKRILFGALLAGCTPEEFLKLPVGASIPKLGGNILTAGKVKMGSFRLQPIRFNDNLFIKAVFQPAEVSEADVSTLSEAEVEEYEEVITWNERMNKVAYSN